MTGATKRPIGRRSALLGSAAAVGAAHNGHRQPIPGGAAERTLHFVPYSNLIGMDPLWSISIMGWTTPT
jgi:hypothetical protein